MQKKEKNIGPEDDDTIKHMGRVHDGQRIIKSPPCTSSVEHCQGTELWEPKIDNPIEFFQGLLSVNSYSTTARKKLVKGHQGQTGQGYLPHAHDLLISMGYNEW